MSTDKLTLKDYIIVYFIIFLLASFIAGFFIGAKVMENKIKNSDALNVTTNEKPIYTKNEITKFYYQIFAPIRAYNQDIYQLINKEEPINEEIKTSMISVGNSLLSDIEIYTFESPQLKEAVDQLKDNINLVIKVLSNGKKQEINQAIAQYLSSQREFYRSIWIWEQILHDGNDQVVEDTKIDWNVWSKANLHKKNFIIAKIIAEQAINTFYRPEDITVHIDAILRTNGNKNTTDLIDVVDLLISSESVHDKDFLKYSNWYSDEILPEIPNFY
ncbi:hypothetical protein BHF71_03735 [Vulcanibacillus modesticaldus]|uniref:Uncharacterized protein n=1 Tax=Vulcanibacillus modesticaldus TaxID=337097 RepID=A0A1D2YSK1_9BACI|nr:hypothetical protein [Vulcanibacillus modesticaldus]OEF97257.1 hypothetical protein BHF71_03735 [Vulcanibacillus modesticaldus]